MSEEIYVIPHNVVLLLNSHQSNGLFKKIILHIFLPILVKIHSIFIKSICANKALQQIYILTHISTI